MPQRVPDSYLHCDGRNRWLFTKIELIVWILLANISQQLFELRPEPLCERTAAHDDFRPPHLQRERENARRKRQGRSQVRRRRSQCRYFAELRRGLADMHLILVRHIGFDKLLV